MEKSLERFIKENPLDFSMKQIEKLKYEVDHKREGIICDEFVEFKLWIKGLKSRQEYFAAFLENFLPHDKYTNLLEVGCGHAPRLSYLMSLKGYNMSALNPNLDKSYDGIVGIKDYFDYQNTPISMYDAIIAQ